MSDINIEDLDRTERLLISAVERGYINDRVTFILSSDKCGRQVQPAAPIPFLSHLIQNHLQKIYKK